VLFHGDVKSHPGMICFSPLPEDFREGVFIIGKAVRMRKTESLPEGIERLPGGRALFLVRKR